MAFRVEYDLEPELAARTLQSEMDHDDLPDVESENKSSSFVGERDEVLADATLTSSQMRAIDACLK